MDIDLSYTLDAEDNVIDLVQTEMESYYSNLNPLDKWLISRGTTKVGSPYYLWSTIHDDNLRLGNLDTMLRQQMIQ